MKARAEVEVAAEVSLGGSQGFGFGLGGAGEGRIARVDLRVGRCWDVGVSVRCGGGGAG